MRISDCSSDVCSSDLVAVTAGFTHADTEYRSRLVGSGGRPPPHALALLPGQQLSNAPEYVVTTGFTYTPEINAMGMRALFHADLRYMSDFQTGSDHFPKNGNESGRENVGQYWWISVVAVP